MTLPASGPLSLSEIQTEFGGSNPISISEYYAAASGVPASGTIKISDFYGKSSANVNIAPIGPYEANTTSPADARVEIKFLTNGHIQISINASAFTNDGSWWTAAPSTGIGNDYEIRATTVSGSAINIGTLNTWQALSSDRTYGMLETSNTTTARTGTVRFEIRHVATSTIRGTYDLFMSVNVNV